MRISLSPGWGSSGIAQFAPHRAHGEAAHGHFDDARSVRRVLDGELLDRAAVEFDQGRAGDGGIEDEAFGPGVAFGVEEPHEQVAVFGWHKQSRRRPDALLGNGRGTVSR